MPPVSNDQQREALHCEGKEVQTDCPRPTFLYAASHFNSVSVNGAGAGLGYIRSPGLPARDESLRKKL